MKTLTVLFVTWLLVPVRSGQQPVDPFQLLVLQYKGKVLRVRHLLSDSKIKYDVTGNLIGKGHSGQWTWHGAVEIANIEGKNGILKVQAHRVLMNYDLANHRFNSIRLPETVEIQIDYPQNDAIDPAREWQKAFLSSTEAYPDGIQPYWKSFIDCLLKPNVAECETDQKPSQPVPGTYKVDPKSGVSEPKIRSKVEPVYTNVARDAKVEGTVVLSAVIDENGRVEIVRVVRPLGWGLEEAAADALSKWRFEPAQKDGQPVRVSLNIEVNFNLRR